MDFSFPYKTKGKRALRNENPALGDIHIRKGSSYSSRYFPCSCEHPPGHFLSFHLFPLLYAAVLWYKLQSHLNSDEAPFITLFADKTRILSNFVLEEFLSPRFCFCVYVSV